MEHATKSPPPVLTIFEAIVKCTMELRNISWGHTYRDNQVHMYDGIISERRASTIPVQIYRCLAKVGVRVHTPRLGLGNTLNTMGEILHYLQPDRLASYSKYFKYHSFYNTHYPVNKQNDSMQFIMINPTSSPSDIKCTPMFVHGWRMGQSWRLQFSVIGSQERNCVKLVFVTCHLSHVGQQSVHFITS